MKAQLIRMSVFAVLTAAAVCAQNSRVMKVNIPFDFVVESQTLPAGQYTVEQRFASALTLMSAGGQVQNIITQAVESIDAQTLGKLVFHRYGNEYFLSEAWMSGGHQGLQLRTTSHERELTAGRAIQTGTTVVAAAK